MADVEGDRLSFAELVERRARARRLVEEVLRPIRGSDKSEPLVTDETLDRASHRHVDFLDVSALIRDETSIIPGIRRNALY
jgi:hypothetical protein